MPWGAIAAVVGVGASIASGVSASNAAADQRAYNAEVERLQKQYRLDAMEFQNADYAANVEFYKQQIAWEQAEFERTKQHTADTVTAMEQDFYGKLATQMAQIVEQDMAEALGITDIRRQVKTETGTVDARAADSGVGGNVVAQLRGDVARQGGEAVNMTQMNATAARNQSTLGLQTIKAGRDASLAQLTIPTFQPLQAPKAPAPINPVSPAAPVASPSGASIALGAISSGINLGTAAASFAKSF